MKGRRCPLCKLGWITPEKRDLVVTFGDRVHGETPMDYVVASVPGHRCDNPLTQPDGSFVCRRWIPDPSWGDGSERAGLAWKKAWSQHSKAFQNAFPRCQRCNMWTNHTHHRIYRSQGGSDAWENLEALCAKCHEDEHRARK